MPSDFEDDPVEVWPENYAAFDLFSMLSTQWRMGMNGPVGLDYMPMFAMMNRMNLSEQAYHWMFGDMRIIEAEALTLIH